MIHRRTAAVLALGAIIAVAPAAAAGNPFAKSTSTAGGYHTWDSDMIDIEKVTQTGKGVYVAVLDTGLVPNWKDYFPRERVAEELGVGFYQNITFKGRTNDPCGLETEVGQLRTTTFIGSRGSSHGTHVASTIIGYGYYSNFDALEGYPLPAIQVRGIAPDATIIPVKVLADYQIPDMKKCDEPAPSGLAVFGTEAMVAAGIDYVTDLKLGVLKDSPVVINMSLGGDARVEISDVEKAAIDRAIEAGVIVVAAASNDGEAGMSAPGSYAPVISAGSVGWTGEWLEDGAGDPGPDNGVRYRMWWLQNRKGTVPVAGDLAALSAGSGDVSEGAAVVDEVYISDFSSRAYAEQDLDVLAPGSWVRGPFAGFPGYNHLPWWSNGLGDVFGNNAGNFYYVGGTSMATPHVASVAALVLEVAPDMDQAAMEALLESTAIPVPATGSQQVWDPFASTRDFYPVEWDTSCGDPAEVCDAVGAGLVNAHHAINALP